MKYIYYNHDRANRRIVSIRSYLLFKINLSNETNLSDTMLIILQTLYILLLLYVVKSWDLRSECNLPLTKMARNSLLEFFIHEQVNERRLNKWEIEWARTRENAVRRGAACAKEPWVEKWQLCELSWIVKFKSKTDVRCRGNRTLYGFYFKFFFLANIRILSFFTARQICPRPYHLTRLLRLFSIFHFSSFANLFPIPS